MKGPTYVETRGDILWNRNYSRKLHEEKLAALGNGKEHAKGNHVPHADKVKTIMEEIHQKR